MGITVADMLLLFPLIFLAGFVDSIAGGGGLISLPAYLLIGFPSHNALATNKLSSSIGTVFSTFRYARDRKIVYEVAIFSVIFSFIGSHIGSSFALIISERYLKIIITILIVIAALFLLLKKGVKNNSLNSKRVLSRAKTRLLSSIIGFLIGMYDGFFGPGTGTFLIILFVSFLSMETVNASGTAKIVNLASNISALVTFAFEGKVIYLVGFPAALFGILGNWIGSGLAIKKGDRIIKPVIIGVLFLLLLKVLSDLI
ncbi:MAG: TSUP family transporter [Thermosipho sp. (in: Bacteria)]|nr:TSUP family transporter [Thermosipho sp. (in: thermotogales)]